MTDRKPIPQRVRDPGCEGFCLEEGDLEMGFSPTVKPPPLPGSDRSRRRRRALPGSVLVLAAILLLAAAFFGIYRVRLAWKVSARLQAIRRAGYPTTLEELNRWYPAIRPEDNAAPLYANAFAQWNLKGTNSADLPYLGRAQPPPRKGPLKPEVQEAIETLIGLNSAVFEKLHHAALKPACRYSMDFTPGFSAQVPHIHGIGICAQLLSLKVLLCRETGRTDDALVATADTWALSRSAASEPSILAGRIQMSCQEIVCADIERLLNRFRLSAEQLARLGDLLGSPTAALDLNRALAGERCEALAVFNLPPRSLVALVDNPSNPDPANLDTGPLGDASISSMGIKFMRLSGWLDQDRLFYLDRFEEYDRAASRPFPERYGALVYFHQMRALHRRDESRFLISRIMLRPLSGILVRSVIHAAELRTTRTALVIERYRLAHGDEPPDDLESLVGEFLDTLPEDPFDGRPLRYRRLARGYVVYSIGPDVRDDDGTERKQRTYAQLLSGKPEVPYDITTTVER